ncbi:hypothetical protein TNCV_4800671 [Trichonephila clavipes]|nr:hypothetical protein TNCV_4800671 [Trichonephila clavipes]
MGQLGQEFLFNGLHKAFADTASPRISRWTLAVVDWVNINVALFSYTRAFGDGPRNFEPWSSVVDDT